MKKYIIGGIAGFLLATTLSAHAEEVTSLIGKTIQGAFPFQIEGKTLATPAIVVDGTSYLPVRAFGEATGYDVSFDADLGISLKKKEVQPALPTPTPSPTPSPSATPEPQVPGDPSSGYQAIKTVILSLEDEKSQKSTGEFGLIQVDGARYVSLSTLSSFYTISWGDPMLQLSYNGQLVGSFATNSQYSKGTGSFTYDGTVYVNLSLLKLKGTVNGDTLVLTDDI
ncbi:hypothetical protein HZF08_00845 [Paenibacillus sp. CGMCC 1.16610]|uniref:Copper amine oxidase-like N-terminal domain-containing protein n=1 Tax=Paenibacillus anseongense TaxID=2682845 RepID=A0ABW9U4E4_9BACL|nr:MULTISPECIES: hypothetical protein [Paenibacillus]MBA2936847.1 hypothetical protein [Paenibacillus sp. CGMCC 1.16610]MVQ33175.1 hypothetical protein [Paenibacillus anseongense]